ncbi:MAG: YaaL family protein [Bacillaceae bacterium]
MFFKRVGYLRKEFDTKLLMLLEECKNNWIREKEIRDICVEPTEQLLYEVHLAELKYFYLLKEAKKRNVSMQKIK